MAGTLVPKMINALVAAFQAAPTLGGGDPALVNVTDSAKVTGDTGAVTLWVAVDALDNPAPVSANSEQQWMPGGGRNGKTEQLTIHCVIQVKSGSDDIPWLRQQAAGVLEAAEDVLAADPSLNGLLRNRDAAVTSSEWRQYPTSPGMAVRVMFTVSATAILGAR